MINVVCGVKSTGRICTDFAKELDKRGHIVKIAYGREKVPEEYKKYAVKIGNNLDVNLNALQCRLLDNAGFGTKHYTKRFIKWVKKFDPDIIHLHNLHGYYINIAVLFDYLKQCNKRIIWTLHDCWAFTGHCIYFDSVDCNKWINQCCKCPKIKEYPNSWLVDRSNRNYKKKKKLFLEIPDLTIVTPSAWLGEQVKKSYLKDYNMIIIQNGIDTDIFKPTVNSLREEYHLQNKRILLGVSSYWEKRKGLDDVIELSRRLDDSFQIVLIGITDEQKKKIPENIITLHRTNSQKELAQFYSMADILINPTYEDNYPTINLEAIACGTPVVTYETGGSGESAKLYGATAERGNLQEMMQLINYVLERKETLDIDVVQSKIDKKAFVRKMKNLYEQSEVK